MTDTLTELEELRPIIVKILKEHEETRNSDKLLLYYCWIHANPSFARVFSFEEFDDLPHFESVRRVRQKIQNEAGYFLPTDPEVIEQRRQKEKKMRIWAVKEK